MTSRLEDSSACLSDNLRGVQVFCSHSSDSNSFRRHQLSLCFDVLYKVSIARLGEITLGFVMKIKKRRKQNYQTASSTEEGVCFWGEASTCETMVAVAHLFGSVGQPQGGKEILAAMEKLDYSPRVAWLTLVVCLGSVFQMYLIS